MHSPLGVVAQGNPAADRGARAVHSADRLWDALAMLLILAGTTLFLLARGGLAAIRDTNQAPPAGFSTWVQRADYFTAQSSLGLALIGAGVVVGIWAAIRHMMRRRSTPGSLIRIA